MHIYADENADYVQIQKKEQIHMHKTDTNRDTDTGTNTDRIVTGYESLHYCAKSHSI